MLSALRCPRHVECVLARFVSTPLLLCLINQIFPPMQSVVMFAAGATAGVLAMHCVSRAREKFEPGAACELQREGDRRVASGLRRALVWRGLQRFQWLGVGAAVLGRRRSSSSCSCPVLTHRSHSGCARRRGQPERQVMCRSRRTRTGSQAISCRYRMAPHPAPCAPADATCRQPLQPRVTAGAALRRYRGEHQVLYPAELQSAYFLMISAYVPRPIALVSSLSAAGVGNVAPYSYSGCVAHDPPTLVVSCCRRPDGRSQPASAGS